MDYYWCHNRVFVWGLAAGTAVIPVAGWAVSISIGVADAIWGDQLYNWVEQQMK